MLIRTLLTATISAFLLLGCSAPGARSASLNPPRPEMDDASVKLAEAASSVSDTLVELARIESTTLKNQPRNLVNPDMPGMSDLISVDWSGPIEQLLERLANTSGYKLRVLGTRPAIPVLVSITATNVTLGTVLRDLDFQASKKAHLMVYPNADPRKRIIELRYAAT